MVGDLPGIGVFFASGSGYGSGRWLRAFYKLLLLLRIQGVAIPSMVGSTLVLGFVTLVGVLLGIKGR